MISNTVLRHVRPTVNPMRLGLARESIRCYISRAHPSEANPSTPILDAIPKVLVGIEERKVQRQEKWEKNKDKRAAKGFKDDGPYRNQDETVEISLNLNLDPRKPGQALRGSIPLPHGTGKKVNVVVFTSDDDADTIAAAKKAGASVVGGLSIIESIKDGTLAVDFDRALATPEMMPSLSQIARVLGPRGLMPNAKVNTIQPADKITDAVKAQAAGMVQYRTDKLGTVQAGIGKGSFTEEQLSDNIRAFMNVIQEVKPESFGKGKKGKSGANKNAKYYLKAYLTSTQGKGSETIDLRTLDPTSSYFMSIPPST